MFNFLRNFISQRRKKIEMGKKGFIGSRKRRTPDKALTLSRAADRSRFLGVLMLLLMWATCIFVQIFPPESKLTASELILTLSQRAPKTVFADISFSYEDIDETEKRRQTAMSEVPIYYKLDVKHNEQSVEDLKKIFDEILKKADLEKAGKKYETIPENKASELVASFDNETTRDLAQLARTSHRMEDLLDFLNNTLQAGIINKEEKQKSTLGQKIRIIHTMGRTILPKLLVNINTPEEAAEKISANMIRYYSHKNRDSLKKALKSILSYSIGKEGNLLIDQDITNKEKEKVAESVKPVIREIKKGEPIITKNSIVDRESLRILETYSSEVQKTQSTVKFWDRLSRGVMVSLLMIIITAMYIYHIHPEIVMSNQKIWLGGIAIIVCIFGNYSAIELFSVASPAWDIRPFLVMDVIPLGLVSILLAVLLGLRAAVFAGLFVSVITALMLGSSFNVVIEGLFVSSIAGFFVMNSTNHRSFFLRSVFVMFMIVLLLDYAYLWEIKETPSVILWGLGLSFANGLITAITALILLFIFEMLFNVSTNMTLLMLCDYNHPLLKRLQLEAPGTYHHSIMVATLAEQAADEIGANPIKVRVAALFHDIGKLTKPEYFVENNISVESKHRELHPRMSSLIILNHVKEGLDMAIKYKLRKIIRDAIQQHHGTDMVYYFYKRALEEKEEKGISVEESEYRYPGPLPHEKEVVLVSLADACEAASRALEKPTHAKVETLVWEIIRKRIRDEQLDEADMTLGELARVKESFIKTLTTMLHGRIAYPKDQEEEDEDDLFMAAKKIFTAEKEDNEKTAEEDNS